MPRIPRTPGQIRITAAQVADLKQYGVEEYAYRAAYGLAQSMIALCDEAKVVLDAETLATAKEGIAHGLERAFHRFEDGG